MEPVDTIRIDLPDSWERLPSEMPDVDEFIVARADSPLWLELSVTDRRVVENLLRRLVNEMKLQRCELAAVYAEAIDADTESGADTGLLAASMVVVVLSRADIGSALSLEADILLAAATATNGEPVTHRELEPPAIVELPVGRVVRTRRLQPFDPAGAEVFVETFMVPVAPTFEHMCLLQFATPNVALSRDFSELFNTMARSFAMYREGEPTPA